MSPRLTLTALLSPWQVPVRSLEPISDFSRKVPAPAAQGRLGPRPVLRLDASGDSDDDEGPPLQGLPVGPPKKRDYSESISQLPPRYPGAPLLRLERGAVGDESSSEEEKHMDEGQRADALAAAVAVVTPLKRGRDHGEKISQLPPRYPGAPMLRIERLPHFEGDSDSSDEVTFPN